jgi:hypothetical protein
MKPTLKNKNEPGPWPLLAKLAAATWMLVVLGFVAHGYYQAPSFEDAAKESCNQLLVPVSEPVEQFLYNVDKNRFPQLLHWKDAISGKELLPYRRGAKLLDCDSLDAHVGFFVQASKKGQIEPVIGVNWVRLFLVIAIPAALIFIWGQMMADRPRKPKKPVHRIS